MKRALPVCIILLLSGCSGYQYVSSPHYVPVNTGKNVYTANISFNSVQFGYAITEKVSLFASGFYRTNNGGIIKATALTKENGEAYIQTDDHKDIEIGATFFKTMKNYFCTELVTGVGYGKMSYSNFQDLLHNYEFKMHADKYKIYVQPVFSFKLYDYLDLSVFSRFTYCNYFKVNHSYNLGSRKNMEPYDEFFINRHLYHFGFLEPGIQLRGGIKNLKLLLMVSSTVDPFKTGIQYRHTNLHAGLAMNIFMKNRKKEIP